MVPTPQKCTACGGDLQPTDTAGELRCGYCRTRHTLPATIPVPPSSPPGRPPAAVWIAIGAPLVGGVVVSLFLVLPPSAPTPRPPEEAPVVPPPPVDSSFLWDDVGGPPVVARVGGRPAVLGRVRRRPDDALEIVAVDPSDLHEVYRVKDLGTYSQGYQAVWFAVSGARAWTPRGPSW